MPRDVLKGRMAGRVRSLDRRALLRPMRLGEMVDTAFRLYQRAAIPVLAATAVPISLCWAAAAYVGNVVLPALFVTRTGGGTLDQLSEAAVTVALGLLVAVPLAALGLGFSVARTVTVVAPMIRGDANEGARQAPWTAAIVAAWVSVFQILAACGFLLLCGALAATGVFLQTVTGQEAFSGLAVVAVILATTVGWLSVPIGYHVTALALPVALIEGLKPWPAARRSARLLRTVGSNAPSSFVTITVFLLLLFVGGVLNITLSSLIEAGDLGQIARQAGGSTLVGPILEGAVVSVPTYLSFWLLAPVWAIMTTLLYYDRIVRLEAYDIRLIQEDVNSSRKRTVLLP